MLATFKRLDELLHDHRQFWQFQPFHHVRSRWQALAPEMHALLSTLDSEQLDQLAEDPNRRARLLEPWVPESEELLRLCLLPRPPGRKIASTDLLSRHTQGRKWAQVTAFAAQVPCAAPVVEWCAGKGHLGRLLAANGAHSVASLELRADLCRRGAALAAGAGQAQEFHAVDVMSPAVDALLTAPSHAVALHACGKLHIRLLQLVVQRGMEGVSVAPCCYYLVDERYYRPLCSAAADSKLRLTREDLHTPLRETVTGGARARRKRSTELRWRLAFDGLQRELRGRDEYLPVPPAPGKVMGESFEAFARWAGERKGLSMPKLIDADQYLAMAEARLRPVREMELVQQLFQRPLETWLALDRALYLEQHGYNVRLQEFCPRQLTPRNILISGMR